MTCFSEGSLEDFWPWLCGYGKVNLSYLVDKYASIVGWIGGDGAGGA